MLLRESGQARIVPGKGDRGCDRGWPAADGGGEALRALRRASIGRQSAASQCGPRRFFHGPPRSASQQAKWGLGRHRYGRGSSNCRPDL
jgi:hypothetical protein